MKFLILALCVCAASAASVATWQQRNNVNVQPWQQTAYASASVSPSISPSFKSTPSFVSSTPSFVSSSPAFVSSSPAFVSSTPSFVSSTPSAVVAVAKAGPYPGAAVKNYNVGHEASAQILRHESDVSVNGFRYAYETDNGIVNQVSGDLKDVGDLKVLALQGSYQYPGPDGQPIVVSYIADENGYQPRSDIIPVAPPVPVEIARALEYIAAHPYHEVKYEKPTVTQYKQV